MPLAAREPEPVGAKADVPWEPGIVRAQAARCEIPRVRVLWGKILHCYSPEVAVHCLP